MKLLHRSVRDLCKYEREYGDTKLRDSHKCKKHNKVMTKTCDNIEIIRS